MLKIYFGSINHPTIKELRARGVTIYGATAGNLPNTQPLACLTPPWYIVGGHKNHDLIREGKPPTFTMTNPQTRHKEICPSFNDEEYEKVYDNHLSYMEPKIRIWLDTLQRANVQEVAVCCFCRTGWFCHTKLAYEYLQHMHFKDEDGELKPGPQLFQMELLGSTPSTTQPVVTSTTPTQEKTMTVSILKSTPVQSISRDDENYLQIIGLLAKLPEYDIPHTLYYQGDISLLRTPIISIIGARNCSGRDQNVASAIGTFFASKKYTIAGGNAFGIDQAGEHGALKIKSRVIAVLPHGFDPDDYHTGIEHAEEILTNGGLLISEYHEGKSYGKRYFFRNRLIVGMAQAVIPICGNVRSTTYGGDPNETAGTHHATQKAKEYGRTIWVPSPPEGSESMAGYSLNRMLHDAEGSPYFSRVNFNGQPQQNYSLMLSMLENLHANPPLDERIDALSHFLHVVCNIQKQHPGAEQIVTEIEGLLLESEDGLIEEINILMPKKTDDRITELVKLSLEILNKLI